MTIITFWRHAFGDSIHYAFTVNCFTFVAIKWLVRWKDEINVACWILVSFPHLLLNLVNIRMWKWMQIFSYTRILIRMYILKQFVPGSSTQWRSYTTATKVQIIKGPTFLIIQYKKGPISLTFSVIKHWQKWKLCQKPT